MTLEEQLQEIEVLIEDFRWARAEAGAPEEQTYRALKEIAKDICGRLPGAANGALTALQRRIDAAVRGRMLVGYDAGALRGIGEELIGRWPTVRRALEEAEKRGET